MSENLCKNLVNEYINWLHEQITVSELDGVCEFTTPFLDRHNDYLQIYLFEQNKKIRLTDGGYILSDLRMSGFDINTNKRIEMISTILNGFGVREENNELFIDSTEKDFPQKKHLLIQAMLAVNDLFVMAQPMVLSLFLEDVEMYLNAKNIRFTPKVSFIGKSGYTHHFDFVIPKSIDSHERIIKAINNPTRNNVSSLIFSWNDTKVSREEGSQAIAFLNDQESNVSDDSLTALNSYNIKPIFWTKREEDVEILTA